LKALNQRIKRSSVLFRKQNKNLGTGLFLALSILIFASSKIDHPLHLEIKTKVNSFISPFLEVVSWPVETGKSISEWGSDVFTLYIENRSLRIDNKILKNWRQVAVNLEIENTRLKKLLKANPDTIETLISARVIGVSGGPYVKSVLVNAGKSHGVTKGMPAINQNGVVGRVVLTGMYSSRVLLIGDLNSRIPVKIQRSNQNAIIVGRNGSMLDLMFLPVVRDVVVGDKILTSGDGEAFPPDLTVGEVMLIEGDNIQVRPSANLDELDFIRILNFDKKALELNYLMGHGIPNEDETK
jgi:rod shape-determining protein MreC